MVPTHPTSRFAGRDGKVTAHAHATTAPRARDSARVAPLHLHLCATPEEVPFARAAITRLCEQLDLDDERTERIRLAVTEACTNCVLHAYDAGAYAPTYVLSARTDQHELDVTVCDRGVGISNARPSGHDSFGLALIHQLADAAEISRRLGGGTKVVMHFRLRS